MDAIKHISMVIIVIGMLLGYVWYSADNTIAQQIITVHSVSDKGLMDLKPYILGQLDGQKLDVSDYDKGLLNRQDLSMNEKIICDGLTDKDKQTLMQSLHLSLPQRLLIKARFIITEDADCRLYLSRMTDSNAEVVSAYAISAVYMDAGVSRLSHCGILKLYHLASLEDSRVAMQLTPRASCDVNHIGVTKDSNRHPLTQAESKIAVIK